MNARYARHISLSEVGTQGQQKLAEAKVLVVGAGGLGCAVLQYLTAAGVGTLGIVDFDMISLSNLQRQVLYSEKEVGKKKVDCAKARLQALNSDVEIITHDTDFNVSNAETLCSSYDIIVDASDNFVTRYCINDACIRLGKPMVFGSLYKFQGQVSVFNYHEGPSYRCLFPKPPQPGEVPNCNEIGVLGVLPGLIGTLQATEVLKMILGLGDVLSGTLLQYDTRTHTQCLWNISKQPEEIEKVKNRAKIVPVQTQDCILTPTLSLQEISSEEAILWIDVREAHELPKIEAQNVIRDSEVDLSEAKTKGKKLVFFCQSGVRSRKATDEYMAKGVSNCYSLQEGAAALQQWLAEKT